MKPTTQNTAYYLQVVFLALVIGIGLQIASAWTPPNSAPPTQTVTAPITASSVAQTKAGSLGVLGILSGNMLRTTANVTEGTACTANGLIATNASGVVLSCQSLVWAKASGASSTTALTSYNMLPSGALAGSCTYGAATAESGASETPTREPAYINSSGQCFCRPGFTLARTGTYPTGVMIFTAKYYSCVKN